MKKGEAIDPKCDMKVSIADAKKKGLYAVKDGKTYYFCNKQHRDEFSGNVPFYKTEGFGKLVPYALILILVGGAIWSFLGDFMIKFMGWFFVVVSLLKMPDWKGFIKTFRTYDILAKNIGFYAVIYPALELLIGIFLLLGLYVVYVASLLLFIMTVGGIGVGIKIFSKEKFKCACLGTSMNIPLTKFTFIEDIVMGVMALIVLIGFI